MDASTYNQDASADLDLGWLLAPDDPAVPPPCAEHTMCQGSHELCDIDALFGGIQIPDPAAAALRAGGSADGAHVGGHEDGAERDGGKDVYVRLAKVRENNRKAQARLRMKRKVQRDSLVQEIQHKRELVQTRQTALSRAQDTQHALLRRCAEATDALAQLRAVTPAGGAGKPASLLQMEPGTGPGALWPENKRLSEAGTCASGSLLGAHHAGGAPGGDVLAAAPGLRSAACPRSCAASPPGACAQREPRSSSSVPAGCVPEGVLQVPGQNGVIHGVAEGVHAPLSYAIVTAHAAQHGKCDASFQEQLEHYQATAASGLGVSADAVCWHWQFSHLDGAQGMNLSCPLKEQTWENVSAYGLFITFNMMKAGLWEDERSILDHAIRASERASEASHLSSPLEAPSPSTRPHTTPAAAPCPAWTNDDRVHGPGGTLGTLSFEFVSCGVNCMVHSKPALRNLYGNVLDSCTAGVIGLREWRRRARQVHTYFQRTFMHAVRGAPAPGAGALEHERLSDFNVLASQEVEELLLRREVLQEGQLVQLGTQRLRSMRDAVVEAQREHCSAWVQDMIVAPVCMSKLFSRIAVISCRPDLASYEQAFAADMRLYKLLNCSSLQTNRMAHIWERWVQRVHSNENRVQALAAQLATSPDLAAIPTPFLEALQRLGTRAAGAALPESAIFARSPYNHDMLGMCPAAAPHAWVRKLPGPGVDACKWQLALIDQLRKEQAVIYEAAMETSVGPWVGERESALTTWQLQLMLREQLDSAIFLVDTMRLCQIVAEQERRRKRLDRLQL